MKLYFQHFRKSLAIQQPRNLIFLSLVFWVPVVLFSAIANEIDEGESLFFDVPLLKALHSFASSQLDSIAIFITNLGSAAAVVIITFVIIGCLIKKHKRSQASIVLITVGGASIMNLLLKLLFERDRPSLWHSVIAENSFSFPSGHAMASSALAFSMIAITWNTKWRLLTLIVASMYFIAVGFTRVYLGVHYPSDVLAGWFISLTWAVLIYKFITRRLSSLNPFVKKPKLT